MTPPDAEVSLAWDIAVHLILPIALVYLVVDIVGRYYESKRVSQVKYRDPDD